MLHVLDYQSNEVLHESDKPWVIPVCAPSHAVLVPGRPDIGFVVIIRLEFSISGKEPAEWCETITVARVAALYGPLPVISNYQVSEHDRHIVELYNRLLGAEKEV